MNFVIRYTETALRHLKELNARDRAIVVDSVRRQLVDQPENATRHRKQLRPNPLAPWCLRSGDLRVYYEVRHAETMVDILAIGVKKGNRVFIGGEEYELL